MLMRAGAPCHARGSLTGGTKVRHVCFNMGVRWPVPARQCGTGAAKLLGVFIVSCCRDTHKLDESPAPAERAASLAGFGIDRRDGPILHAFPTGSPTFR